MSETMIEKVARATREAVAKDRGRSVPFEEMSFIVARAAIDAMREPTNAMVRAGEWGSSSRPVGESYSAMVDTALAELPE